jgi:hypothetical protein
MRTLLVIAFALLFAGCSHAPHSAAPRRPAPAADLAAPVLAPMAARERLLEDLGDQKQLARDRAATLDDVADRDH